MNDTERLVSALRQWADGGEPPDFPFDDLAFTLRMAADDLERRPTLVERFLATDFATTASGTVRQGD